jgi:hypothetical protein
MAIASTAAQPDRIGELKDELREAEDRMEEARIEFVDAQAEDPTNARDKRRAWDRARAARNAIESLLLMQGARSVSTEQRR